MTLLEDIAECNKARWELARILLGERITGDIVELHKECIAEATRLLIWEYEFRLETHDWTYLMSDTRTSTRKATPSSAGWRNGRVDH